MSSPTFLTLAEYHSREEALRQASDIKTPLQDLEKLACSADETVRTQVGRNGSTPSSSLALLAEDISWRVRQAVAGNKTTPTASLLELVADSDTNVVIALAKNPALPYAQLCHLATHQDMRVLETVADNPRTPPTVLEQLSEIQDRYIPQAVAHNDNTPPATLTKLSNSTNDKVRSEVAANSSTSIDTLLALALNDDVDMIRNDAHLSLRRKTDNDWIATGMQLKQPFRSTTFGDALLQLGFTSIYQKLLAMELQNKVSEHKANHSDTTQEQNPDLTPRSLRM